MPASILEVVYPYTYGMKKWVIVTIALICIIGLGVRAATSGSPNKSEVAQSLAYSGCTFGLTGDSTKYEWSTILELTATAGLLTSLNDQGLATKDLSAIENRRIRTGIGHVKQAWITAGTMDAKWKPLNEALTQGINLGIKSWNSGSTFSASVDSANSLSSATLISLCRIAQIGVTEKAGNSVGDIRKYVINTAGKYLPPLPSN